MILATNSSSILLANWTQQCLNWPINTALGDRILFLVTLKHGALNFRRFEVNDISRFIFRISDQQNPALKSWNTHVFYIVLF